MRVLITGATGRVGANLVKHLASAGSEVTAMVMPGDPQQAKLSSMPGVRIATADLGDQAAIDAACQGVTHVVHLAAQLVRGDTPVDRFYDINAFGTLRLLEAVVKAGDVQRFLLASTDGTYRPGDPPMVPLPENAPQEPADYYGTSKLLGEIILRNHAAQFGIPYSITRFATVLDPSEASQQFRVGSVRGLLGRAELGRDSNVWQLFRHHPDMLDIFNATVGTAADNAAVSLVGPGNESWSMHLLDVRDAVQGLYKALTVPNAEGRAFNITAAAPTTFDEGAGIVAELDNVPKITVEMPITWRLEMTTDAARDVLGYLPRYDFRAMVESALAESTDASDSYIPARI